MSMIDNDDNMPVPEWKNYKVSEEYAMAKTRELLDMIDFKEMLGDVKQEISDIQDQVENKALFEHDLIVFMVKNEDVFEGCVFNWMSEEEFADYLKERYSEEILYSEYEVVHREMKFKN